MSTARKAKTSLHRFKNREKAKVHSSFFKTGKGEYGEGDFFIGVTVPQIRSVQKHFKELQEKEIAVLLHSKIHEERLLGALILTERAKKADPTQLFRIFKFYLGNTAGINNWDLVDLSAPHIVGRFLHERPKKTLYTLVVSKNMWERRIAIVATLYFIRQKEFADVYRLSTLLLKDKEDLMHKATGWMLREAGKKNPKLLVAYLKKYHAKMPRTMFRYAIERFPEPQRKRMLKGQF